MRQHSLLICLLLAVLLPASLTSQTAWEALNGPTGLTVPRYTFRANDRVLMSIPSKGLLLASTDEGLSWFSAKGSLTDNQFGAFVKDALGNTYMISNTNQTICRYDAAQNDWVVTPVILDNVVNINTMGLTKEGFFWTVSYLPTAPGTSQIHVSTDGGQSFTAPALSGPVMDGWYDRSASYSAEHNIMSAHSGSNYVIYHFNLNGEVQAAYQSQTPFKFMGYNTATGVAYATNYSGNLRSADGGITWQPMIVNPAATTQPVFTGLTVDENNRLWASTTNLNFYFSDDDGLTWTFEGWDQNFEQCTYLGNQKWLGSNDCNYTNLDFAIVTDQGATVTDLSAQFKMPTIAEFHKANNGDLYARRCNELGFLRSMDNGWTWQEVRIDDNGTLKSLIDMAMNSQGILLAFISNAGYYFRSADDGQTWEKIVDANASFAHYFSADSYGNFYIHFTSTHLKSSDGGYSFQPIQIPGMPVSATKLYAGNGDVFFSGDLPNTNNNDGMFRWNSATQTVDPLPIGGDNGYSSSFHRISPQGIVYFKANGSPFTPGSAPSGFYKLMPGTNEPVMITWPVNSLIGSSTDLIINNEGHLFIFHSSQGIYKSEDEGATWTSLGSFPSASLQNIYQTQDGYVYIVKEHDVLYRSATTFNVQNYISGKTWLDTNLDCANQPGEPSLAFAPVRATGAGTFGNYADQSGQYKIAVGQGTYQVQAASGNPLLQACQTIPEVNIQAPGQQVTADLPYKETAHCPLLSVGLTTPRLRRCFDNTYHVFYRNQGTAVAAGAVVEATLDPSFVFQSSTIPVTGSVGNKYTFEVGDLAPGQSGSFHFTIKVSCGASLGQLHCVDVRMLPENDCTAGLPEATYSECRKNTSSFDPNDKHAFVDGMEAEATVEVGKDIEYLINFQNTGTDTAFTVVVEDPISPNLDIMRVQPTSASHAFRMDIKEGRILRFTFDNIMLPDSNVNEPLSHGFVKFRIAQAPGLDPGVDIRNRAGIYFDYNSPVITNEVHLSTIALTNGTGAPVQVSSVKAYPNPFDRNLVFEVHCRECTGEKRLDLFDMTGRLILSETFTGARYEMITKQLHAGVFFYSVSEQGRVIGRGKLVKG